MAHIGVIEVLEAEGLRPALVAGTSMGALVGAAYAQNPDRFLAWDRFLEFFEDSLYRRTRLADVQVFSDSENTNLARRMYQFVKRAYLGGRVLTSAPVIGPDVLRELVGFFLEDTRIEDTVLPFAAVATDLTDGREMILTKGSIIEAVMASMSIPGYMSPVEMGGHLLFDGGVVSLVPISAAINLGATRVVAVDVERNLQTERRFSTAMELIMRADEIQGVELKNIKNRAADMVIRPPVGEVSWYHFERAEDIRRAGQTAAQDAVDQVRRLLEPEKPKLAWPKKLVPAEKEDTLWRRFKRFCGRLKP